MGTPAWCEVKKRVAALEGRGGATQDTGFTRNEMMRNEMTRKWRPAIEEASITLVDKILSFIDDGEWAQLEGGEHDGRWINARFYPNQIFETGWVREEKSGDVHYFPISGTGDKDPKGLALHYEMVGGGQNYTIQPNIWHEFITYEQRKKERRETREKERHLDTIAYQEHADNMASIEYED